MADADGPFLFLMFAAFMVVLIIVMGDIARYEPPLADTPCAAGYAHETDPPFRCVQIVVAR